MLKGVRENMFTMNEKIKITEKQEPFFKENQINFQNWKHISKKKKITQMDSAAEWK